MSSEMLSLQFLDIDKVTRSLSTEFNPLHRDFCLSYQVIESKGGYTLVSFALPDGMTRAFIQLLESMGGFLRSVDIKSKAVKAVSKVYDPVAIQEREKVHAAFTEKVCALYDGFIKGGSTSSEAIRLSNSSLKAIEHPWATHGIVSSVLRKQGRFRRV
jgi:hypothetical protein